MDRPEFEKTEYGLLYDNGPHDDRPTKRQRYGVIALVFVMLILIILLFILYANEDPDKIKKYYGVDVVSSLLSATAVSSTSIGMAVSFASDGQSVVGAGTSVYKDALTLNASCLKFLNVDSLLENSFLYTYTDSQTGKTTMQHVEMSTPRESTSISSSIYDGLVHDIATLDRDGGLFVGINQDQSATADTATVFAGRSGSSTDGAEFSFGTPEIYGGVYSMAPAISRLDSTSFIIAYFDNRDNGGPIVAVRYGTVDTDTLAITLSDEVVVADNSAYAVTFTLVGLSEDRFMIAYYNGTTTSSDGVQYGPLTVLSGRVEAGQVSVGLQDEQMATLPNNIAFRVAGTRVSDTSAIIVFGEMSTNYGVTAVMASVGDRGEGGVSSEVVVLGSVHRVSSGGSFAGIQQGVLMDLDVEAVGALAVGEALGDDVNGAAVKFAVLYSDFSNSAKMTLSVGMITQSGELHSIGPDYVLSAGSSYPEELFSYGGLALQGGQEGATFPGFQVGVATAVAAADCTSVSTGAAAEIFTTLNVMHVLPSPVGLVFSSSSSKPDSNGDYSAQVLFSGTMEGLAGLKTGAVYYCNSLGELLGGDVWYGVGMGAETSHSYYEDEATGTLVDCTSSLVGIAVTDSTLLLKMH